MLHFIVSRPNEVWTWKPIQKNGLICDFAGDKIVRFYTYDFKTPQFEIEELMNREIGIRPMYLIHNHFVAIDDIVLVNQPTLWIPEIQTKGIVWVITGEGALSMRIRTDAETVGIWEV